MKYARIAMNGKWYWVKDLVHDTQRCTWKARVVNRYGEELDQVVIGDKTDMEECHEAYMNLTYGWLEKRKKDETSKSDSNSSASS